MNTIIEMQYTIGILSNLLFMATNTCTTWLIEKALALTENVFMSLFVGIGLHIYINHHIFSIIKKLYSLHSIH